MSVVDSSILSDAPNIAQEKEQIGVILCEKTGEVKVPYFCLGYLGGVWTFKCTGSIVGSDEQFFKVVDENIEVIKQAILDKIADNGKNNKEE